MGKDESIVENIAIDKNQEREHKKERKASNKISFIEKCERVISYIVKLLVKLTIITQNNFFRNLSKNHLFILIAVH